MVTPLQPIEDLIADSKKPDFKFPKVDILNEFTTYFTANSHEFAVENKLTYFLSQLNIYEKHLYKCTDLAYRRATEMAIDSLRKLIEKHMFEYTYADEKSADKESSFKYYPDIRDPNFNATLSNKNEFINTSLPLVLKTNNISKDFKLSNAQRFAKNFISENTPYNGILLWHEVGVGKTCAGISIAENFRSKMNANNKKIIILTPSETLQQNWTDEIFNVEKELNKKTSGNTHNVQCTGTTYSDKFSNITPQNHISVKRKVKRYISQFYTICSYNQLASSIIKKSNATSWRSANKQKNLIEYVKKEFSNRLIIMDEIHITRQADGSTTEKKSVEYLELIARYAENTKIVLLTATPMYNISSEIIWLLNILLLNDKRAPLLESDIFTKDGIEFKKNDEEEESIQDALNLLINKSRGYISYVRGSNPISFPLRIEPTKETYTPTPTREIISSNPVKIDDSARLIENMTFFKNVMSDWQWNHLKQEIIREEDDGGVRQLGEHSFSQKPIMGSNIIFPSSSGHDEKKVINTNGIIGNDGFDECFTLVQQTYRINSFANKIRKENTESFIHTSNLGQFSRKLNNILKSCITNRGIGFIFSQYLKSGITVMALILEQNGFVRYIGNGKDKNLLTPQVNINNRFCAKHMKYYKQLSNEEKKYFVQARYILLDGSVKKQQLNQLIKECRGEGDNPNLEGEHIKIILGSKVVEQGLSLLRVREVHIMDPWHHLNQMEQAVGRAVRNKSHIKLAEDERNVTVYLHSSALPNKPKKDAGIETPDEQTYRRGYNKKFNMAKVERALKINAVDCDFNKKGNVYLQSNYTDISDEINPLKEQTIVDSKGNRRIIDMYDKDNDARCEFRECEYNCLSNTDSDEQKLDNDTNSLKFSDYDVEFTEEYILTFFKESFAYYEETIINEVTQQLSSENDMDSNEFTKKIIYIALNNIVEKKLATEDIYGRRGYIINIGNLYIFQPFELENTDIPMLYRYIPNFITNDKVTLDKPVSQTIKKPAKFMLKQDTQLEKQIDINRKIIHKWSALLEADSFDNYPKSGFKKGFTFIDELNVSESDINKIRAFAIFDNPNNFSYNEKLVLLQQSIIYKINKNRDYAAKYFNVIFEIYDKCGFIIRKQDKITGFRFVELRRLSGTVAGRTLINLVIFVLNSNGQFEKQEGSLLKFKSKITKESRKTHGWRGLSAKAEQNNKFYIKDTTLANSNVSTGVACPTNINKIRLIELCQRLIIHSEKYMEYKKISKKTKTTKEIDIKEKLLSADLGKKIGLSDICYEIELLLRFLDSTIKDPVKRRFYIYEERLLQFKDKKK